MTPRSFEKEFLAAYEAHADALFKHCYFRVFNRTLAQDMVQEAFTKTWKHLSENGSIQNLRAFLYRVLTNIIIDHSRKKKEASLEELTEEQNFAPPSEAHKDILQGIEAKELRNLLNDLEEEQREVLTLRYLDGLTPKEIGLIRKETPNTVSVRIHRALEKLRAITPRDL